MAATGTGPGAATGSGRGTTNDRTVMVCSYRGRTLGLKRQPLPTGLGKPGLHFIAIGPPSVPAEMPPIAQARYRPRFGVRHGDRRHGQCRGRAGSVSGVVDSVAAGRRRPGMYRQPTLTVFNIIAKVHSMPARMMTGSQCPSVACDSESTTVTTRPPAERLLPVLGTTTRSRPRARRHCWLATA
jgi:hypothetical protein